MRGEHRSLRAGHEETLMRRPPLAPQFARLPIVIYLVTSYLGEINSRLLGPRSRKPSSVGVGERKPGHHDVVPTLLEETVSPLVQCHGSSYE